MAEEKSSWSLSSLFRGWGSGGKEPVSAYKPTPEEVTEARRVSGAMVGMTSVVTGTEDRQITPEWFYNWMSHSRKDAYELFSNKFCKADGSLIDPSGTEAEREKQFNAYMNSMVFAAQGMGSDSLAKGMSPDPAVQAYYAKLFATYNAPEVQEMAGHQIVTTIRGVEPLGQTSGGMNIPDEINLTQLCQLTAPDSPKAKELEDKAKAGAYTPY